MQGGIGPLVRLRTRSMYSCLEKRASWNSIVEIDSLALSEMVFWAKNVRANNGSKLLCNRVCETYAYSDASTGGYGGYIVSQEDGDTIGRWSQLESPKSSIWRELEAVHRVIQNNIKCLARQNVQCAQTTRTWLEYCRQAVEYQNYSQQF